MNIDVVQPDDFIVVINGHEVRFNFKVLQTITTDNSVIIMIKDFDIPYDNPDRGRNIFSYDARGNFLWRIEDAGFKIRAGDGEGAPQGYTGMGFRKDGRFVAIQPIGCDCFIDLDTGKIVDEEINRG